MAWLRSPVALATALVVAAPTLWLVKRYLRARLVFRATVLPDIPALGSPTSRRHGTAIICGGSIGGLLTARVCADHFDRVVVIEPEGWALSDEARHGRGYTGTREVHGDDGTYTTVTHKRSRIWQYTTFHGYQLILINMLRKLYPNFDVRAEEQAIEIKPAALNLWLNGHYLRMPTKNGVHPSETLPYRIHCSRAAIETTIRAVTADVAPEIEYIHGTVTGFKLSTDSSNVTAVALRKAGTEEMLDIPCDMVVDCTGNAQAGLKLLSRALPPAKAAKLADIRQEYDPQLRFSSLSIPCPPNFDQDLERIIVTNPNDPAESFPASRFHWWLFWGALADVDSVNILAGRDTTGEIIISAGHWGHRAPPVTLDDLREYALSARIRPVPSWFLDVLALLEPVKNQTTSSSMKLNSCSRIFYESVKVLPRNFIAHGDSVIRLNPRNGEGVTKCAMGATTLDGVLRRMPQGPHDSAFSKTFFKLLAGRTSHLWNSSRYLDYASETTVPVAGEKLSDGAYFRRLVPKIFRLAERDDDVATRFILANNFLIPNTDLVTISTLMKLWWQDWSS
ncbi:hypothetical protein BKA62DRAFT_704391 [Auriculariales sp. MPI-PUGE-AT-0066]|nr:hypothetical protein BKA62DRAFT_704391 [Auriculariales sp. MPI-PUGE-AT-0066]